MQQCIHICDEWIILVQCSSFSVIRHLKMAIKAEPCCVGGESERKKEQFLALLTDYVVHKRFRCSMQQDA
jgi:hypothetical protein